MVGGHAAWRPRSVKYCLQKFVNRIGDETSNCPSKFRKSPATSASTKRPTGRKHSVTSSIDDDGVEAERTQEQHEQRSLTLLSLYIVNSGNFKIHLYTCSGVH